MARTAVLLANGFEEIEAITIIDVLRRADIAVDVVAVTGTTATGSHGITVTADRALDDVSPGDHAWIVLPGGMPGASTLRDDARVQALLRAHAAQGRGLAAICAAPIALAKAGVLEGKRATCYPGFEGQLAGARVDASAPVVDEGNVITSRGPGTAMRFALTLVEKMTDGARRAKLERAMLVGAGAAS